MQGTTLTPMLRDLATTVAAPMRVVAGQEALTEVALDIARSHGPVTWQVRLLEDATVAPALLARPDMRGDLYLFDRHVLRADNRLGMGETHHILDQLAARGATVVPYAGDGDFLHGKLITGTDVAGRRVALLRTNTDEPAAWHQANMGVVLTGRGAELATDLTVATALADTPRVQAVADAAEGVGLLVHDAENGADHIRPAIADIYSKAAHAKGPLTIIDKELSHPDATREIVAAHAAGARVDLTVGKIDRESQRLLADAGIGYRIHQGWVFNADEAIRLADLHDAGVEVEIRPVFIAEEARQVLEARGVPFSTEPFAHLNAFGTDGDVVIGSYHHFPEMVDFRGSQELAVRLHGSEATEALAEARRLVGIAPD